MRSRDVVVAILARDKARYLPLYLACLESQTWPKQKTHLYIRSNDNSDETVAILQRWLARTGLRYASVHEDYTRLDDRLSQYGEHEWNAHRFNLLGTIRQDSVDYARTRGCHYFVADCDNFIQPGVVAQLVELVEAGFSVAAPLLSTGSDRYTNVHVETDDQGYLRDGPSYEAVRSRTLTGVIGVDVVHCTYMIGWPSLGAATYADGTGRHEYIVFSHALRQAGVAQYVDNRADYGRLSRSNSAQEFCQELRLWHGTFACWAAGEPANYVRTLLARHPDDHMATYATSLGTFTVFRNEEFIAAPMRRGQAWEQDVIEMVLPALSGAEDVIDAGAHVGTHAVPYAGRARHVYAFEPQPAMHALLVRNLDANHRANVTAYPSALGDERRAVCMSNQISDGASAGAPIHQGDRSTAMNYGGIQIDAEGTPVHMDTIDGLELDSLRYLKVDTEGAESLVFWGARETIRRQRPLILYERNHRRLADDVLDRLGVPHEARRFDIDVFAHGLGYHDPIPLPGRSHLLLPNRRDGLGRALVAGRWSAGSFYSDGQARIWCRMPGRGDFPTAILDEHTLCVWFTDLGHMFTGTLAENQIAWSNRTFWNGS